MHTSFAKRFAILEGLRERTRQATAEFYQRPNVIAPTLTQRFNLKPNGNNAPGVIERATGKKIITEPLNHNNATYLANEHEVNAE